MVHLLFLLDYYLLKENAFIKVLLAVIMQMIYVYLKHLVLLPVFTTMLFVFVVILGVLSEIGLDKGLYLQQLPYFFCF